MVAHAVPQTQQFIGIDKKIGDAVNLCKNCFDRFSNLGQAGNTDSLEKIGKDLGAGFQSIFGPQNRNQLHIMSADPKVTALAKGIGAMYKLGLDIAYGTDPGVALNKFQAEISRVGLDSGLFPGSKPKQSFRPF